MQIMRMKFFFTNSSCRVMNNVCPACTPGFVGAGKRKGFVLAGGK